MPAQPTETRPADDDRRELHRRQREMVQASLVACPGRRAPRPAAAGEGA